MCLARHALPLRSSPARDEGATGAFCSCGIYRNRTSDTPAFPTLNERTTVIQHAAVFQLRPTMLDGLGMRLR